MTICNFLKSAAISALVAGGAALPAHAVFFHIGSGSIDGSLCVGNDCVASPAFGFDTIILRENNLRIFFDDTSTAAAFPPNDWRLTANDSANGGDSHFSIEDATAGRRVFRVFAGARANALTVDSQGDVGLGTATPALDLTIKTGDTPSIRLEQDGTSGFTPQTWDVAGNEAGFFVRDATSGSTLPFRIIPGGAPSASLLIDGSGQIGMGAGTNPSALLHMRRGGAGNDGLPRILMDNTDATEDWFMDVSDTNFFRISVDGSGVQEFQMDTSGNLTIEGNLVTGGGGTCDPGPCDAVFDPSVYTVPAIEDHAALMWKNKHLPAVGPTRPGEPINVTLKLTRMLNELEHAHIYIEQLNMRVAELEQQLKIE
jgi:hypothetical protein